MLIVLGFFIVQGCENSIDFQEEREEGIYSIYGLLLVSDINSFIRVHDNRVPIDAVTEDNLNVNVTLRNTNTGETELLERQIITFEGAVTHNFMTNDPLDFGTEYVITLEDETGYRDSVRAITPKETSYFLNERDFTDCANTRITIDIFSPNIALGEFLQYFIEFEWNSRLYRARGTVFESDTVDPEFDNDGQVVTLAFNLEGLLREGLGTDEFSCFNVPVTDYRFEYTHYGIELEEGIQLVNEDGSIELPFFGKKVLGAYTGGFEFSVSDTLFDYDYWFPE
ncbi:MAG: hypothetical protein ED557_08835 [Balneola sp.]|nr:MAG: hypothetical protein ED557_08835 [Balneola sp.]